MPVRKGRGKRKTLERFETTKANLQKKLPPIKLIVNDNSNNKAEKFNNRSLAEMNTFRTASQNRRGLSMSSRQLIGADLDEVAMIRNRGRKPLVVISSQSHDSSALQGAKSRTVGGCLPTAPRRQRIRSSLSDEKEQDSGDSSEALPSNKVLSAGKHWTHITQQIRVDPAKVVRYRKKRDNHSKSRVISENALSLPKDDSAWSKPSQKPTIKARKGTKMKGKQVKPKSIVAEISISPDNQSLEFDTVNIGKSEATDDAHHMRTGSAAKETKPSTSSERSSAKSTPSPKPMSTKLMSREPTPMSHINMSDFADFNPANIKKPVISDSLPEYQKLERVSRFKGASNRVPSGKDAKESGRKSVSQRSSALRNNSSRNSHADLGPPILVSKIEHKSSTDSLQPPISLESRYLAPVAAMTERPNHLQAFRGESIESEVSQSTTSESLPQILFGSPPPAQSIGTPEEYTGEISIIVPKLPMLSISGPESPNDDKSKPGNNCPSESDAGQSIEEEPIIRFTGGLSIKEQHDGLESGYSSMTPRLSVDSTGQALSPFSSTGSMLLEVPGGQRSLTPNSTTSSIFLDVVNSRPQSSYLDARHLSPAEQNSDFMRRLSSEGRPPRRKLPAIHSRNSDYDSADDNRLGFTPLPLQSVRTESDVELSDGER